MLRGLYTAASGMNHELKRQDAIANNLANINTAGFKKDDLIGAAFQEELYYAVNRRQVQPVGRRPLGWKPTLVNPILPPGRLSPRITHLIWRSSVKAILSSTMVSISI